MEFENRIDLSGLHQAAERVRTEIGKLLIGQEQLVEQLLVAFLANGHVLIEGVPGVAKTLSAKLLARSLSVAFSRIQFTPDLMPADIIGTTIFNQGNSSFEFKSGPIFSNIVLIDEINRAPAKTQSALFEVMEERQISVDGRTYPLQAPFLVLATQNPIEQEGTYRLPEAQLDRFLFKIEVGYPTLDQEVLILERFHAPQTETLLQQVQPVLQASELLHYQKQVREVHLEPGLRRFIAEIVHKTRNNRMLYLGASPRASLAIMHSSKALAAVRGRDFVSPDDILEMVEPVLNHRILLTAEKEMEGASPRDVVRQIVKSIEIPR